MFFDVFAFLLRRTTKQLYGDKTRNEGNLPRMAVPFGLPDDGEQQLGRFKSGGLRSMTYHK